MKLISWNVNGIRAVLKKGFMDFLKTENPDVLCIQETKARPEQVDMNLVGYDHKYWNSAEKKGYSGTAIFSKIKPLNVTYDIDNDDHKSEGRAITVEFDNYYLVNVYVPNSKRGLLRLVDRQEWDKALLLYLKKLEEKKPVILCGDLNVAHKEIDIKNAKSNMTTATKPGNAGFTDQERLGFSNFMDAGLIDTFRQFHPDEPDNYTWWSYMFNARTNNVGWRIDYFLASKSLKDRLKDAFILPDVLGSDHCPVGILID
ncbi:exodeoxyribonuclease III [archaeon]|jgi:exodeoxyribonuclease III|nr:exodeoxyribonuclease III [Candidatus Woesearchaeota archaeon]MBT3464473.1 exodeoxyribonuclease III [archaeon]MBT4352853.1 exodeoxyribonuclease III [archaeon]MBT4647977.1 exodeoxyribonuclease III [archaeon]MBT6822642.1 exodeoxyribonuclease III [archaeon]